MASGGSMDLGNLSRRLNPENKQFIVLDTLLLFSQGDCVVGQHFQGLHKLQEVVLVPIMFAAHNPCCDSLLSSSQQGEQWKQQW